MPTGLDGCPDSREGTNEMTTRVVHVNDNIPDAVYIGRAMPRQGLTGSVLANPYKIGEHGWSRSDVITAYTLRLTRDLVFRNTDVVEALIASRDKPLSCWCRHDGRS